MIRSVSFARTALIAFFALGLAQAAQAQTVIKMGASLPKTSPPDPVNGMYELFKEEVEARTNGAIRIDIAYGHSLGNPDNRMSQAMRGIIQMPGVGDAQYQAVFKDANVFSAPYLFPTEDIAWKVFDGPIGERLAEGMLKKTGVRFLGYWTSGGFKHYSSNKPIRVPADLKGQKIRVLGPLFALPVTELGGSAVPIPFPELYTSLKTGVVDGQDNAVWVFNAVKLYEVQKYLILSGHIYAWGALEINDAFFQKLPKAQQNILVEAGRKAVLWNRQASRSLEQSALAVAKSRGVEILELPQDVKKQFIDQVRPAAVRWLKQNVDDPTFVDAAVAEVNKHSN